MGGTKRKAESSSDGSSDVASLKAQLKALERENAQLKQQGKAKPKAAAAAASQFLPGGAKEGAAAGAPQQKKSKKAKLGDTGSGEAGQKKVPKPAAKAVGDAPSSGEPEEGAGRAKKAEMKAKMVLKREVRKQRKVAARLQRETAGAEQKKLQGEEEEKQLVDVSAWKLFSLHPTIERALALCVSVRECYPAFVCPET